MIKKILLACSGGFSTSMLVQRMKEAAVAKNLNIEILAVGEDNIFEQLDSDFLLLSPQNAHKLEDLSSDLNMPVFTIDMMDYGMMNGEKVLAEVLEKVE